LFRVLRDRGEEITGVLRGRYPPSRLGFLAVYATPLAREMALCR
jgi:hypothetical protein